ncbi:transmembrane protein with metallophosphoesterase domain isoform X1 [Lethenteron reissneri]|uniref:transmembrane protein with metallophosphoesterase domain isoform X1 n=1 Tax=Lethenteron reissneri TaxID=7753 RepID=UPI002AB6D8ED|nr:transmembrane protein with metallophosphoesterase domain isoform X1 [Lethenteron reissneri]
MRIMKVPFSRLRLGVAVAVAGAVVVLSVFAERLLLAHRLSHGARARVHRLQMIAIFNVVIYLPSKFVWTRCVTEPTAACSRGKCESWAGLWAACVATFLLLVHTSLFTALFLVHIEPHVFSLVSSTCLGAYILLNFWLLVLLTTDRCLRFAARALTPAMKKDEEVEDEKIERRKRARAILAIALLLTVSMTLLAVHNAAGRPHTPRVEVRLQRLPANLSGLKVALLSDIHLGPTVGRSKLAQVVDITNGLRPDLVVIVGDLADSLVSNLKDAAQPLSWLNPRLGTYFVTGNHEYYTHDVQAWFQYLRSLNIHPLHNQHVHLGGRPGERVCLAGVDDIEALRIGYPGHGMDLEQALAGCEEGSAIILLAHQPRAAQAALEQRPDIDLVLAGHTHGGQFFPVSLAVYLYNPFFAGLYRHGEHSQVYVSQGSVFYGMPMRLGSTAEVTEIVLLSH